MPLGAHDLHTTDGRGPDVASLPNRPTDRHESAARPCLTWLPGRMRAQPAPTVMPSSRLTRPRGAKTRISVLSCGLAARAHAGGLRRSVRVSRESGRGGIRTPETGLTRLTVFKTAAFNRSATLPRHSDPTRSGGGSLQALNLASVRSRRGGRAAEGTRLLSEYGGKPPSRVRIPPSPLRPGSGSWWLHRTVPRRRGDSRVSGISMGATCDSTPPESSPTSASTTA